MKLGYKFPELPRWLIGKESACCAGDMGSSHGPGRSPGEGNGYSLQYSGLGNSKDCIHHGVAKSQTRFRDFHFHPSKQKWKRVISP